jgi:2-haloacid dehalogenase
MAVRALVFDVFGTVVDWRSSIIREGEALGRRLGIGADWSRVADAWRARYPGLMQRVRTGELPWTRLDDLHRMGLVQVLADLGIRGLSEADIDDFNRAWHRLDPWPDVVPGLDRLGRRFILATLSNGNVSLIVDMAKRAGLRWDVVLGAEVARRYKPDPEVYLTTASLLDLPPSECMMVAAHNQDLQAASALGFRTAFILRPTEHGPGQTKDIGPTGEWDIVARGLDDLADKLGADWRRPGPP